MRHPVRPGKRRLRVNEVRANSDPAVSQNPIYWAALTDAQLASGGWLSHQK